MTFVVRDLENGVLVSLASLMRKLLLPEMAEWVLYDVELEPGSPPPKPFGYLIPEFEERTRKRSGGFRLTQDEFSQFLKLDIQFLDGTIEGFSEVPSTAPVVSIHCEDSTQWEISTESTGIAQKLTDAGLERSEDR